MALLIFTKSDSSKKACINLKADLPITKKYKIAGFALMLFPVLWICRFSNHPLVLIVQIFVSLNSVCPIGFQVASLTGSRMPKSITMFEVT